VTLRARWVTGRARWVTGRARWVTLRARWVTLRARWVTLRARWVTLRARCVALQASGELLLGLERGLCSFNLANAAITLVTPFEEGRDTRPNDGRVDREGNFVIGSYNNQHR
jgi:hypothetical protein